jgi:uncharacterized protein YbjT (DUF2867 family)
MNRPRLAITGATGFVGQVLVRRALAEGWQVNALSRTGTLAVEGADVIKGHLADPASLDRLVKDVDAIIHVAGVVNAPDRDGFETGNVAGTLAVIEAARRAGVARFVHVSSLTAREPDLSLYGASKARSEMLVAASGLDWTIIRPPAVYGPGDRDMLDLYRMARWGFIVMPPQGRTSLIEVSDLARLLVAVIPFGETRSKLYEVDDNWEGGWSYRDYGKAIGKAVGKAVAIIAMPRPVVRLSARLDRLFRGSKAKLTLDRAAYLCHPDWVIDPAKRCPPEIWQPAIEASTGLKGTAAAYRAASWL